MRELAQNYLLAVIVAVITLSCDLRSGPQRSEATRPRAPSYSGSNPNTPDVNSSKAPRSSPVSPTKRDASGCDPNYSGCVPIALDVDCVGGRGNGPAYVEGPVQVVGNDIYDLDRDGDGIACE